MKQRIALFLTAILLYTSSFGQKTNNCVLFDALLTHDESKKTFYFDKHSEVPILFVDVNGCFKDCNIANYYGREIRFVKDSSQLEVANYSNIVITSFATTPKGYILELFYKIRGAFFKIEFKRKRNKLFVSKLTGGYF